MTASQHQHKVSVAMPVWNDEAYLAGAIESILTQTFADFELLLIDDGSTDRTPLLIRDYHDHRIRRIEHDKNLGVARSLNEALERASGRYFARMDAHDISWPQRLARQVECLDANPQVALVTSDVSRVDARGARIGLIETPRDPEQLRRHLRVDSCITPGSVMLRTSALRELGGYDESMESAHGYDLWLRLSERYDLLGLPETLYAKREREAASASDPQAKPFDARARSAARQRWAAALVAEVVAESVSVARAARRSLDLLREEQSLRPATSRAGKLMARTWQRLPGLHRRWHALANVEALARLEHTLEACVAGWQGPDETHRALALCLEELAESARPPASAEDLDHELAR